jgi:hyperosmotically inducible protein
MGGVVAEIRIRHFKLQCEDRANVQFAWVDGLCCRQTGDECIRALGTGIVCKSLGRLRSKPISLTIRGGFMNTLTTSRSCVALICASLVLSLSVATIAAAQKADSPPASADVESTQPGTDAIITGKVKAELTATPGIPSTQIEVTTQNGTVILSGLVDTKDQIQRAVAAAKSVRGVHEVSSTALRSKS